MQHSLVNPSYTDQLLQLGFSVPRLVQAGYYRPLKPGMTLCFVLHSTDTKTERYLRIVNN